MGAAGEAERPAGRSGARGQAAGRSGARAPAAGRSGARARPAHSVGIDLLDIERLERALQRRPALAGRLFTASELAYACKRARPGQHLAARFCAKEAVAKALGLEAWSFSEVEVVAGQGLPRVRLSGAVAERAAALGVEVAISLTHSRGQAAAVAVAA